MKTALLLASALLLMLGMSFMAVAQEEAAPEPTIDSGSTAWMLTATALVLFMTIPGLALFYGGLVRTRNVLSVLMQCFAITALVTVLWTIIGYSLAFNVPESQSKDEINLASFVGGTGDAFLKNIEVDSIASPLSIPTSLFSVFQMTFAIITPALICGAYAERMKFSAVLLFTTLWLILVYAPICHMAWSGDGSLFGSHWAVLDFAGGTVVHINAGIAALVACILLGKRAGYPERPMPPHNMTMCVTGAAMLWVGWFGFNAGSAGAADGFAGMAMLVTQIATAAACLTWLFIEWIKNGKPSALGAVTGAVAGLVAITPASGTCGPMGALAIGFASGLICFIASTSVKRALGYDDALDAFGVHCIGGIVGALLTGIFAADTLGGAKAVADLAGGSIAGQFLAQAKAVVVTLVYSGIASAVLLKVTDLVVGLRVTAAEETEGLDITQHEEAGYNL